MRTAEEMQELIALYSLNALEAAERLEVDDAVAADASLRRDLDAMRGVAAALAEAADPAPDAPSAAVWAGIQSGIAASRRAQPAMHPRTIGRWGGISALLAVAAVVISVALAVRVGTLQRELDSVDEARLAEVKRTAPNSVVVSLEGAEGHEDTMVEVVLGADGVGYVLAADLPTLAPERTYQLWAIVASDPAPRVVSAGVLGNDPAVVPFQATGEVVGFAITEEIRGGVPVSEGETIAVWLANA